MSRSTFIYTVGVPGSGKSYYRCARFLLDDYLVNTDAVHCSNFPIKFEPWEDANGVEREGLLAVAERRGLDRDIVADRVKVFPEEVTKQWQNVGLAKGHAPRGPWDQLDEIDISGWHIAIDEIHNYCGRHASTKVQQRWEQWLGEIRHQGATVEFLTQSPNKVARCIPDHCEQRYQLLKGESLHDFWFKIPMYDWYQLRAKVFRRWYSCCWQIHQRQELGKWKTVDQTKFSFEPEYFGVYDSHSAPVVGAKAGGERPMEWQTMRAGRLLLWFVVRNDLKLLTKGALGLVPPVLLLGGPWLAPYLFTALPTWFSSQMTDDAMPEKPVAAEVRSVHRMGAPAAAVPKAEAVQPQALTDLAADYEGFTVGVVSRERLVFRNGFSYAVGEEIDMGPHEGRTIESIDFVRRMVHLDDGEILRLGAAPRVLAELPQPGTAADTRPNVRANVPSSARGGATRR